MKVKITQPGQPCRKCGSPVYKNSHVKPPTYKPGGYFFAWWLVCPSPACGALFMVEAAKVWFDVPQSLDLFTPTAISETARMRNAEILPWE